MVDYGQSYANTFATITIGNEEVSLSAFGNGDGQTLTETSGCLDVAGHQFTHNVVAATAGLVYQNQSGALNEHFADAFGTAIDKRYEDADDLLGENCTPQGAGLRSLADPTTRMQPAHNRDYQNLANTDAGNHGEILVNSGIPNKAYAYYTATSVETAEKVWYRALSAGGLTPNAQFLDFTSAVRSACAALNLACGELDTALGSVGLYEAVSTPMGCPEHSTAMGMQCICDMGYQPSTDGASCQLIPMQSCPAHASQVGEFCYCDAGYVTDAAGTGCVRETEAPCVAHAHRVGERCICDEGYYGDPNVPEGSCEQAQGSCPPLSVYDAMAMGCACIAGFEPDMAGTSCVPSPQGCGRRNVRWPLPRAAFGVLRRRHQSERAAVRRHRLRCVGPVLRDGYGRLRWLHCGHRSLWGHTGGWAVQRRWPAVLRRGGHGAGASSSTALSSTRAARRSWGAPTASRTGMA